MNRLAVANLTAEEFAPFRMVGLPEADGAPLAGDVHSTWLWDALGFMRSAVLPCR
jgi:hypothetical protein